ncbi:UbiD family decarboxylase, partial [bacterium AH-315-N22]|nr:UbiD family decarboxylase [bacterium AH-315-N22]
VLGEGQLSLTKFLILTDGDIDITNFPELWTHVLERIQWDRDLFVFANVSQDTLDYTGPSVNKGSKAMMMGLGKDKIRELPTEFSGNLPAHCQKIKAYLPGTLVIECENYEKKPELAKAIAKDPALSNWPAILLVDNCDEATCSIQEFLWTFFTRFEPAADIHGADATVKRFHVGLTPPIVFDCRMKPWYTDVLEVDAATRDLVDSRIDRLLPSHLR